MPAAASSSACVEPIRPVPASSDKAAASRLCLPLSGAATEAVDCDRPSISPSAAANAAAVPRIMEPLPPPTLGPRPLGPA
eukprot:CAMPEP_0183451528 /NCGR_PEP_ID=MMETSP0370-20130417/115463_1 /TAXON_ID=268820 /ORGANISM="Peridinium aciculiferum, Strain PAER-2" /LENGTH=79 /DNA_ID=CAMNT_0025642759 /DNA_START=17 /DNA_END=253 /DNA_ORIENTATION=-